MDDYRESTSLLTSSVVESIDAILATMHGEKMGERREGSLYMQVPFKCTISLILINIQELVAYLSRLSLHSSHSPSALGKKFTRYCRYIVLQVDRISWLQ